MSAVPMPRRLAADPTTFSRRTTVSTVSQSAFTPVLEPPTQQGLEHPPAPWAGPPPLYELSPADARVVLRTVQESVAVDMPPATIEDRVIAGGPTGEVNIRIVKPLG